MSPFDILLIGIAVVAICCIPLFRVIPRIIGERKLIILSKEGLQIYSEGTRALKSLEERARKEIILVVNLKWGSFQPIGNLNEVRLGDIKKISVNEEQGLLRIVTKKGLVHELPARIVCSYIEHDMPRAILLLEAPCFELETLMDECRAYNTLVYADDTRAGFYANGALPEVDAHTRWQSPVPSATPPS